MGVKGWWRVPKVSAAHKEARREHLLACAERVFLRLGYRRARLQDVMDEAGVSRGSLYDYFSSKQELFEAVRARRDAHSLARLHEIARGEEPVTLFVVVWTSRDDVPDEEAVAFITALLEYNLEERQNPAYRAQAKERLETFTGALTAVLEAGVRRGEFTPKLSLAAIARFLIAAQDGAALGRLVLGDAFRAEDSYAQGLSFFARESLGIAPRRSKRHHPGGDAAMPAAASSANGEEDVR